MYGGRVTDECDRRVLNTYLDEYMGDFLFDKNNPFSFALSKDYDYNLPKFKDCETFISSIMNLPHSDAAVVFGLNPNAEITYYANYAKEMQFSLLLMQSTGGTGGGAASDRDAFLFATCDEILSKTPSRYDVISLRQQHDDSLPPTLVVLFQELEAFNKLISNMSSTLNDLKRALKGEIGMNASLDDLAASLFNGLLPESWRGKSPQTEKKLGSWIMWFVRRFNQYDKWVKNGEPAVIWLSGLHIPESYTTALVQDCCRKKKWALDKSTLFTTVTKIVDAREIKKKPDFGCYVQGLYLEGVSWDEKNECITTQKPKELIFEMPLVQIIPVEANKLKLKDSIKVPVYVTQARRNAAGKGLVMEADLNSNEHPSHWVLQGIACCLNTDE